MTATELSLSETQPLLALRDATVIRGGRVLFQSISLTVAPGGGVQLCGDNGVGKTSLLRALAGALPLARGELWHAPGGLAFLPADDGLWQGQMTVRAALADWAAVLAVDLGQCDALLARLGLTLAAAQPLNSLSMGQKRRLSWARLLLRPARLWLVDEPFNSLDRQGVDYVTQLMRAHLKSGGGLVAACHENIDDALGGGVTRVAL